jgi:hypothetical protein
MKKTFETKQIMLLLLIIARFTFISSQTVADTTNHSFKIGCQEIVNKIVNKFLSLSMKENAKVDCLKTIDICMLACEK